MPEYLPESLVNRFAVAMRDVLWYRNTVERFLTRAGVPEPIMIEVRENRSEATILKAQRVVDLLEQSGDSGRKVLQDLFTQLADWSDLTHLRDPDKKRTAVASQKALKDEIKAYADRKQYIEEKEREQHQERTSKGRPRALDHARLASFRERFDTAFSAEAQARGNALEALLNDVFDYFCPDNRGPFRRTGEQVDGHFRYDGHDYFCEIRWRNKQTNSADVSILRDRASAGFGGDVRALFISFNGFTPECLESMKTRAGQERVILMDGLDLRAVLNADIAFDVLLSEKHARAVRDQESFVSARQIVLERITGEGN